MNQLSVSLQRQIVSTLSPPYGSVASLCELLDLALMTTLSESPILKVLARSGAERDGIQQNSNVSNGVIAFEGDPTSWGYNDIYMDDTQTNNHYQVTDTPGQPERLYDMSVGVDGVAHVVWARPYGTTSNCGANFDIYSLIFRLCGGPLCAAQSLFDQLQSYKPGSVVPIRFQLLNAQGTNISSASLVPTGLVRHDTAAASDVQNAGNSNPDRAFRYDPTLQGCVFNLSTKSLSVGIWELQFTVPDDPLPYQLSFGLR